MVFFCLVYTESSEYMVFSICFDPLSVSGVQENGQISIKTGSGRATCDAMHILPDFCGMEDFFTTTQEAEPADPISVSLSPTDGFQSGGMNDGTPDKCTSTDALNIGFLLDESGSINSGEWGLITQFVERIISFDVSPESYVSLWEFASLPGYKQFLDWTGPKKDEENISDYQYLLKIYNVFIYTC